MSLTRSRLESLRRDLTNLQEKVSQLSAKASTATAKAGRVRAEMVRTKSASTLATKQREAERADKDAADAMKKRADIEKQLANKTAEMHKLETKLVDEQQAEQKKTDRALKRAAEDNVRRQRTASNLALQSISPFGALAASDAHRSVVPPKTYDVFISHASEDKDLVARPLAEALASRGVEVWFDEATLTVGDSLRRKIDEGLAQSRFGVVILSPAFFAKNWPQYELDGLVARQMNQDSKVILPIWHHLSKDDLITYSPSLAGILALTTASQTIDEIASELARVVAT